MKNEMDLSFTAKIENVSFARTCVASFLTPLNPCIDDVVEIKTIIGEAVSNAIIHGYNNDGVSKVLLSVMIENQQTIKMIVQDFGKGIKNIEEAKKPMFTSKKELEHAGMGLTIIEALSDRLEIISTLDLGTKLIMVKSLQQYDETKHD